MSDNQQESAIKKGVDWVAKHWPRIRLGHEGVMLEKIQRQQRCVETLARNTMTGDMQNTKGWPADGKGEDMGVTIGDVTNNYYPPAEEKPPAGGTEEKVKGPVAKAAPLLLAAILGGGLGSLGTLLPSLLSAKPDPPAATDQDTTRRVEFEKWVPGE